MKKLFVLFFATMLAGQAWAQSQEFYYDALYYSVTDFEKREVAFLGLGGNTISGKIVVPSKVEYYYDSKTYTVTSVASRAFYNCVGISSVTIPNSVTSIGSEAFAGVKILYYSGSATGSPWGASSVNPEPDENGFVYADNDNTELVAFLGNGDSISIPNSVKKIGDNAFYGCSGLTSVTIPNTVTSIGKYAFFGCYGLTTLTIPSTVTSIGENAFWSVKSIIYTGTAEGEWGSGYINPIIDENGFVFTDDNKNKIKGFIGSARSIRIPDSVTSIEDIAFFYYCPNLKSVYIPSSVTSVGENAFNPLMTVCCEASSKPDGWILNTSEADVVWNVQTTENQDFEYGFYTDSQYGNTANLLKYKGESDFVSIPNALFSDGVIYYVTGIDDNAFKDCVNVKSITLGESIKTIGKSAFENSGLKELFLPSAVESIGSRAFAGCKNLKILIPESVVKVDANAFDGCTNTIICCVAPKKPYNWSNKWNENGGTVAWGCLGETSTGWFYKFKPLTDSTAVMTAYYGGASAVEIPIMTVIDGSFRYVTSIEEAFIYDNSNLTSVTIPNSVTNIGTKAFSGCRALKSINIPNSVTTIGKNAFWGCSALTSINIPNSVTTIGSGAFGDCSALTSINISNSVTTIDGGTFADCSALISIDIPNSVTSIGKDAFNQCSGLVSITIGNSVTLIGESAFEGCCGLTSITIPNSVTSIGARAFWGCDGLTSINIPNSVTSIGKEAFANCKKLKSVAIPGSVTKIGEAAFYKCDSLKSVFIPESVTSMGGVVFFLSDSLTIYCEASSKPDGWSDNWNFGNYPVVWGAITAVSESAADNLTVYARGNAIIVENAFAEILVYDAMGRLVCRDATNSISTGNRAEICVNGTGVYLVKVGNVAKRVIVN